MDIGNINYASQAQVSPKNRTLSLLLCIFLGQFGAHYFYSGRIVMGLLYVFTRGFFYVGWIIDIIRIATGTFKDGDDRLILEWKAPLWQARARSVADDAYAAAEEARRYMHQATAKAKSTVNGYAIMVCGFWVIVAAVVFLAGYYLNTHGFVAISQFI